jgi:hypothetical protein
MELALATKKAKTGRALAAASWQLLFLIAISYGIAYLVAGCMSFAADPASAEPRSGEIIQHSDTPLHAELVCGSASTRLWEHSECSLPK